MVSAKEFSDACWEAGKGLLADLREELASTTSDRDILASGGCSDDLACYMRGADVLSTWASRPAAGVQALSWVLGQRGAGNWDGAALPQLLRSAALGVALAERRLTEDGLARTHNMREAILEAWDIEMPGGNSQHDLKLFTEVSLERLGRLADSSLDLALRAPFFYTPEYVEGVWRDNRASFPGLELDRDDLVALCRDAAENFPAADHDEVFESNLLLEIECLAADREEEPDDESWEASMDGIEEHGSEEEL